jgi:hypothetical protein
LWFKYDNLNRLIESRLTGVSGGATATFAYDGDALRERVKATVNGVCSTYCAPAAFNICSSSFSIKRGKKTLLFADVTKSNTQYTLASPHPRGNTVQ